MINNTGGEPYQWNWSQPGIQVQPGFVYPSEAEIKLGLIKKMIESDLDAETKILAVKLILE